MTCDYEKYKTSTFTGKPGTGKLYMIKTFGESLKDIKAVEATKIEGYYFVPEIDNLNALLKEVKKLEPRVVIFDEVDKIK